MGAVTVRPGFQMASSGFWGKMMEIEDEVSNLKQAMLKVRRIYKRHTKIPKKQLITLLKHDLMMNSQKCIELGLVDELWQ